VSIQQIPADVRATQRKSQTVRMGRDDAPTSTLERVATNINGSPINRAGWSAMTAWTLNDEGFTTSAPVNPAPKDNDVMTSREADDVDAAAGIYRQRDGAVVRTVARGDDPLPTARQISGAAMSAGVSPLASKRADRIEARNVPTPAAQRDAAVAAYLAGKGFTGVITPQIRSLALDALAFADQVAAMAG
jgi:hypothetical protein